MFAQAEKVPIKLPAKYSTLSPREKAVVRSIYIRKQNDRCYYCNEKLSGMPPVRIRGKKIHKELFPEGFFTHPVHLHHNHDTDLTIGAVHAWCNAVLWEYEDE